MHLLDLARGFLIDLLHLPFLFKLFLLFGAASWLWHWWKRRQHQNLLLESSVWPVYRARVVWAQVTDRRDNGEGEPSSWEGILTYSYTVPGHELEVGEYTKPFYDDEDAHQWAQGLRDTYIDVRVDPRDSRRSVWQEESLITSPPLLAPVLPPRSPLEPESWGIRQIAAILTLGASITGTLIASWIQLSCVLGRPVISAEANTSEFFAMHIGAIVCSIISALIGPKNKKISRLGWRESFPNGSGASRFLKICGVYYTVVFTYGWVRQVAEGDGSSHWLILMFSAGWLLFYLAAAFTAWSALQGGERSA